MTISTSEKIGLIDTNILVYRADQDSTFHLSPVNLINRGLKSCLSRLDTLRITFHVLYKHIAPLQRK